MYIQTYSYNIRLRKYLGQWIYDFVQNLCGRVTGHQWSKTEWGYGGKNTVDVWCRWCNKFASIPIEDAIKIHPELRKTWHNITGEFPALNTVCWGDWYQQNKGGKMYEVVDGATHVRTGERLIILRAVSSGKPIAVPLDMFDNDFSKVTEISQEEFERARHDNSD